MSLSAVLLTIACSGTPFDSLKSGVDSVATADSIGEFVGKPDVMTTDVGPADLAQPDVVATDVGPADLTLPEMVAPDIGPADLAQPDVVAPDAGLADLAQPDVVATDVGFADLPLPDIAADAPCAPACADDKECGDDGCGGACGECDDADACTSDSCAEGTCVYTPVSSDDQNACTGDSCDPLSGEIAHVAIECGDSNECTEDSCDPVTGCQNVALECDDSNECTEDSCDPLAGCLNVALECNDANPCTDDSCDPLTGCINLILQDGTPCLGGELNACLAGACVCLPACEGKECGPDGCGGSCGECNGLGCLGGACAGTLAEVWVDDDGVGDPEADGSAGHPFGTILEGVEAASEDATIYVLAGSYSGVVELSQPGLTVLGEGSDVVHLGLENGQTGFHIAADGVTVSGFEISGGLRGVHIEGLQGASLSGGELQDLLITALHNEGFPALSPIGVLIEFADDLLVDSVTINLLESIAVDDDPGEFDGEPADVIGISVKSSAGLTLLNCELSQLASGAGLCEDVYIEELGDVEPGNHSGGM